MGIDMHEETPGRTDSLRHQLRVMTSKFDICMRQVRIKDVHIAELETQNANLLSFFEAMRNAADLRYQEEISSVDVVNRLGGELLKIESVRG